MTTARKIIARALSADGRRPSFNDICHTNLILDALTAAGFRVLAPEEVDPVTVEKCDGQACYYYGCQHLPGCALKEKQG